MTVTLNLHTLLHGAESFAVTFAGAFLVLMANSYHNGSSLSATALEHAAVAALAGAFTFAVRTGQAAGTLPAVIPFANQAPAAPAAPSAPPTQS